MPWAKQGYPQFEEQLLVASPSVAAPAISQVAENAGKLEVSADADKAFQTIKGEGFEVQFDMKQGTINKLVYGGESVIVPGYGSRLRSPSECIPCLREQRQLVLPALVCQRFAQPEAPCRERTGDKGEER